MKSTFAPSFQAGSLALLILAMSSIHTTPSHAQAAQSKDATGAATEVTWFDGTKSPMPKGQLLSGNTGYLGPAVTTGLTYSYPEAPDNPADVYQSEATKFGNRLFDGAVRGDWHVPVGANFRPLVIDFDFGQFATVNEIAVAVSRNKSLRMVRVEIKPEGADGWTEVLSVPATPDAEAREVHRLNLPTSARTRHLRLSLQSTGDITYLDEVWIWGEAKPVGKRGNGILPEMKDAVPGDATILDAGQLASWRRKSGVQQNGLTWQLPSTGALAANAPIQEILLQDRARQRQSVKLSVTRSESEGAAVQLVNADTKAREVTVRLGDFRDAAGKLAPSLRGELYVAGAIWTRRWGQTLRPLFSADNKLGGDLMEKYLTNGAVIKDFPQLHLPPGGTATLWLKVSTRDTAPGTYTTQIEDGVNTIPVSIEVLPLALPTPDVWLHQWNFATPMIADTQPFHEDGALRREVESMQREQGITVWNGLPTPGTDAAIARDLVRESGSGRVYYKVRFMPPMTDRGYNDLLEPEKFDDAFRAEVADNVRAVVQQTRELGLSYDDWALELWDEPNTKTIPDWAAVAKIIMAADPQVRLYMNPLFWAGDDGFVDDATQHKYLDGWYNDVVNISVPIMGQIDEKRFPQTNHDFYDHPRMVRAFFIHPCPGRMISWEAFRRGYNGWGFYSYYVPRADAWNDFDTAEFDYQIVYPGPRGAIPTFESEAMRESWEDFRLLTLLKEQKRETQLSQILDLYQRNLLEVPLIESVADRQRRTTHLEQQFPTLRQMALQAALETH